MKYLPQSTQTIYSSLLQKLQDSRFALLNNVGFSKKEKNGITNWYCQYTDISGKRKQRFIGPESPATNALKAQIIENQHSCQEILNERSRMVAMVSAGGANMEKGQPAKIIQKLSDAGVFENGGILIGSYAFSTYGNLLGVVFDESMRRTEDMDMAYDSSIEIGFVANIKEDIEEAYPGMAEPKRINPWVPPYEMIAPDGFKIEFLTARTNPGDKAPVRIERFEINAQPLEYLDYLIEEQTEAAVLYGSGVLVNVPNPARFAIHKLAVSQLRQPGNTEKRAKDISQATALIEYYLVENPGALMLASDAARTRGDRLHTFIAGGIKSMKNVEVAKQFEVIWNAASPITPSNWDKPKQTF